MEKEPEEGARRHAAGPKRSELAHRAVLEAAQEALAELGYQRTTIEVVARRAGVSKQTIYRWWGSKSSLFMEVYTDLARDHVRPKQSCEPVRDLEDLWRQLARFYRRTAAGPALAGLLADAQFDDSVAETFRTEFLVTRRAVTIEILQRGVDAGVLRDDCDLEIAVDTIAGAVWYRLLVGNATLSDRFVKQLLEQVVGGLAA